MGTITPNISVFIPDSGEELFNASFSVGQKNIDSHDHSGAPYNGVQIGTDGIQDGAITPIKLSKSIFNSAVVTTTDATPTLISTVPMIESSSITIEGRFVALRTIDAAVCAGGNFVGTFHYPTGGIVGVVGVPNVNIYNDSAQNISFILVPGVGSIDIKCVGEGAPANDIKWSVNYNIISLP